MCMNTNVYLLETVLFFFFFFFKSTGSVLAVFTVYVLKEKPRWPMSGFFFVLFLSFICHDIIFI